jgi:hypothetical protein
MHAYATDSVERKRVPLYIAATSALIAWGVGTVLKALNFTPPWWVDVPSFLTLYELVHGFFDRILWQWRPFRWIGLVKVPNLTGIWKGYLSSTFDDRPIRHPATLTINQRWTHIGIRLVTERSESNSLVASIVTGDKAETTVNYEYLNEPKPHAAETMHMHRGTAVLTIEKDGKAMRGHYYTGRGRQTFGELFFNRISAEGS